MTTPSKHKNILKAAIIIAVIVVSSIGTVIIYNQLTATRISLSLSTNQIKVIQGNSSQIKVSIDSKGNPENITLTAILNSSSIQYSFMPAISRSSFNTTLTIEVPDSTQTGNYSLAIEASGDTTMAEAFCTISVLSANVTVSGNVRMDYAFAGGYLTSIQFEDNQTRAVYVVNFPFISITSPSRDYSIVLQNEHTYNVTINFYEGVGNIQSPYIYQAGTFHVYAPAGSNSITNQNFNRTVNP